MEKIGRQKEFLKTRNKDVGITEVNFGDDNNVVIRDPVRVRGIGNSEIITGGGSNMRRKPRCSTCRREGHNRTTCPPKCSHGSDAAGDSVFDMGGQFEEHLEDMNESSSGENDDQFTDESSGTCLFFDEDDVEPNGKDSGVSYVN
ncbi:protein FAR1-RELATED SEQUENCE 5-like [Sesbania bispinosa]|nr:protein FAR1-RELATED SEQUENCE 5-like [Sesbania bispinosa]